jgi:histidyl-tRNA synthetase
VTLQLNTLGDAASREAWRLALIAYFRAVKGDLSEDSQERLEKNPLRILDSKDPRDKVFTADAPRIDDYLSDEAQAFFARVTEGLAAAGVDYVRAPSLVRGLDYYRHTAFEFVTDRLGAQGTVLGGGRYDGLIEALGGPHTPAVGWAAGIERLAMLVGGKAEAAPDVVVVVEDDAAFAYGVRLLAHIRRNRISAEMLASGSPRKRYDKGVKLGAECLVVVGIAADGVPSLKVRSSPISDLGMRFEALVESFN